MRAHGVVYARCGGLELELGMPLAPAPALVADPPVQPEPLPPTQEDLDREWYSTLLHSSGADPSPFVPRRT